MVNTHHHNLTEADRLAVAKDDAVSAHMGVPPYDPDRLLPVRYADVIAARNAVGHLLSVLKHNLDVEHHRQSVQMGVAMGVVRGPHEFETVSAAATFLDELRTRLTGALPHPLLPPRTP